MPLVARLRRLEPGEEGRSLRGIHIPGTMGQKPGSPFKAGNSDRLANEFPSPAECFLSFHVHLTDLDDKVAFIEHLLDTLVGWTLS
jgi:hypothetical protein